MRAGRSRPKRRRASTLSRISDLIDPMQGGDAMRRVPFFPMLITVLITLGGYLGCQPPQQIVQEVERQVEQQVGQQLDRVGQQIQNSGMIPGMPVSTTPAAPMVQTQAMAMPARTASTLLIGSFNMQRLGPTKLRDATVMQYYASIIQQFDVIALQEITSKDQNTVPELLRYVNAGGARYAYTISPQLGRSYFEQYAFVFDTTRVASHQDACFVMRDDEDLLHREPFVGRFQTLAPNPFGFVLINIHTDPDEVREELDALANVYINVSNYFYQGQYPEDDVILLGDLNADPRNFRNLGNVPNLRATIAGISTMVVGSKTNDNILVNQMTTREFTGRAGVFNLMTAYQLAPEQARRISDHQPVWAEFTVQEMNQQNMATQRNVSWAR